MRPTAHRNYAGTHQFFQNVKTRQLSEAELVDAALKENSDIADCVARNIVPGNMTPSNILQISEIIKMLSVEILPNKQFIEGLFINQRSIPVLKYFIEFGLPLPKPIHEVLTLKTIMKMRSEMIGHMGRAVPQHHQDAAKPHQVQLSETLKAQLRQEASEHRGHTYISRPSYW